MSFASASWTLVGQDCALCGVRSGERLVCADCEASLPRLAFSCGRCAAPLWSPGTCADCLRSPPAFDGTVAVFEYRFPVDRLIHRFKFAGDLALGRWLGDRLRERVMHLPRPDLIVAPPLTASRLRERGFNQALEMAKVVALAIDVRVELAALSKVRDTTPQRALGGRSRRSNLRAAFRCGMDLRGEHVAVVDDVITTGATASAVARALKSAGAGSVSVWAVARTP